MNRIAILLVASVLLLGTAGAHHDECPNESDVTVITPAGGYYVVVDDCMPESCLFSIWVYQESNGHPGLQRADNELCEVEECGCRSWDSDQPLI